MSINQVIRPYCIYHLIVNGDKWLSLLNNIFLQMFPSSPPDTNFQQYGALPHYKVAVRQLLADKLSGSWIGREGPIPRPARSPDLTPLHFFLCTYMKDKVYKTACPNLTRITRRITSGIRIVNAGKQRSVWRNNETRLITIIWEKGVVFYILKRIKIFRRYWIAYCSPLLISACWFFILISKMSPAFFGHPLNQSYHE